MKRHYPRGKLRADDQGAVQMRMMIQDGVLLLMFDHEVAWVGLRADDVERWIAGLQTKLEELRRTGA